MLLLNGSANRDEHEVHRPRPLRHPPQRRSSQLRTRTALLSWLSPSATRGTSRLRGGPQAMDRLDRRLRQRKQSPHLQRPRMGTPSGHNRLARPRRAAQLETALQSLREVDPRCVSTKPCAERRAANGARIGSCPSAWGRPSHIRPSLYDRKANQIATLARRLAEDDGFGVARSCLRRLRASCAKSDRRGTLTIRRGSSDSIASAHRSSCPAESSSRPLGANTS